MRRRSSRSRSPDRRGYYERDWAREREWEQYERERAEWEYRRNGAGGGGGGGMGMRGRSRSPPGVYDGEFRFMHLLRSDELGKVENVSGFPFSDLGFPHRPPNETSPFNVPAIRVRKR